MNNFKSKNIFLALVTVMILIKLFDLIFNPNKVFPGRVAVFSWVEILVVLILGIIGLLLYKKIKLPKFDNKKIRQSKTLLYSIGFGLVFSTILVIIDFFAKIGDISVGLPLAPLFYIWGAISSEVIFRLFGISLFIWLFGNIILKKKYKEKVYWIGAIVLSLLATTTMLSAFSNPSIIINKPSTFLLTLFGLVTFLTEMFAFKLLKKYGFLSNLIFRLSFYLVWHIIWPLAFY